MRVVRAAAAAAVLALLGLLVWDVSHSGHGGVAAKVDKGHTVVAPTTGNRDRHPAVLFPPGRCAPVRGSCPCARDAETRLRGRAGEDRGALLRRVSQSCSAALPRLRELLADGGLSTTIELRRISDDRAAKRERFLGSPTVRVNGRDVEPGAERRSDYGMKCRLYRSAVGVSGQPPQELLRVAVSGAAEGEGR